jgi:DNA-binding response OmpR family regulator
VETNVVPALAPRILIVEDDEPIRTLLTTAIRRQGLDVDEACDGAVALRFTAEREYAVILLDLSMPVLDGIAFLDAFRAGPRSANPVIFVMTAFADGVAESLRGHRVHAIWRKPFDILSLVETIREVAYSLSRIAPRRSSRRVAADDRARTRPG